MYSNVFNEQTSPFHIVFTYSLYKAILDLKLGLKEISKSDIGLKATEQKILEFLSHSGAIYVLITSVAKSIESILNRKVINMSDLSFDISIDFQAAVVFWQELFPKFIHFVPSSLNSIIETRVKKEEIFEECFERFCSMIESTRDTNSEAYDAFSKYVIEKKHTHNFL